MPYIPTEDRKRIVDKWKSSGGELDPYEPGGILVLGHEITKPGELNYAVTELCKYYINEYGHSYTKYNEVIGVLECAKLELYRRLAVPYEDEKIKDNGDVY